MPGSQGLAMFLSSWPFWKRMLLLDPLESFFSRESAITIIEPDVQTGRFEEVPLLWMGKVTEISGVLHLGHALCFKEWRENGWLFYVLRDASALGFTGYVYSGEEEGEKRYAIAQAEVTLALSQDTDSRLWTAVRGRLSREKTRQIEKAA